MRPPFCPKCDKEGDDVWRKVCRDVEQSYKEALFAVNTEVTECRFCGFHILVNGQLTELDKKVKEKYENVKKEIVLDILKRGRAGKSGSYTDPNDPIGLLVGPKVAADLNRNKTRYTVRGWENEPPQIQGIDDAHNWHTFCTARPDLREYGKPFFVTLQYLYLTDEFWYENNLNEEGQKFLKLFLQKFCENVS